MASHPKTVWRGAVASAVAVGIGLAFYAGQRAATPPGADRIGGGDRAPMASLTKERLRGAPARVAPGEEPSKFRAPAVWAGNARPKQDAASGADRDRGAAREDAARGILRGLAALQDTAAGAGPAAPVLRGAARGYGRCVLNPDHGKAIGETLDELGPDARLSMDSTLGTLRYLDGPIERIASRSDLFREARARGDIVGMAQATMAELSAVLNVPDPHQEFRCTSSHRDELGMAHARFQQTGDGVGVFGAELLVHFDAANQPVQINGLYAPSAWLPRGVEPAISEEAALEAARQAVGAYGPDLAPPKVERTVYWSPDKAPVMTYQVDLSPSASEFWHVFVSVADGRVVHLLAGAMTAAATGTAVDLKGIGRTVNCWEHEGAYFACDTSVAGLYDPSSTPPVVTNIRGGICVLTVGNRDFVEAFRNDQVSWVTTGDPNSWDPTAVSVLHNFRTVEAYYRTTHRRNSMNDGGMNIIGCIHALIPGPQGASADNACWHPGAQMMFFGDGQQAYRDLPAGLDVTAHELTHGVVSFTANLRYEGQSGALNEHFADFFAAMVDRDEWLIGDGVVNVAGKVALRDMSDPQNPDILDQLPKIMAEYRNLPNTPEQDNGGVHINCGIPNYAAYLLAEGQTGAVGRDKAERIYYRALTTYLTQYSQFVDFRAALLSAARDLYGNGSAEAGAVAQAMDAVQITGGDAPAPPPTPGPVATGSEFALFMRWDGSGYGLYQMDEAGASALVATRYNSGTRPAISGDGTWALYVGADRNLYWTDGLSDRAWTDTGNVRTLAMSKDQRQIAFTTVTLTNTVTLVDTTSASWRTIELAVTAPDGRLVPVSFADVLTFDFKGEYLVYDALSRATIGQGGGYGCWGVYALRVKDGVSLQVLPVIEGLQVGNPSMANAGAHNLVADYEYMEGEATVLGILSIDLHSGRTEVLLNGFNVYAQPTFRGDDAKIVYRSLDSDGYYRLYEAGVAADRLSVTPNSVTPLMYSISPYELTYPVGFRSGSYAAAAGSLGALPPAVDFGTVTVGAQSVRSVTFTNNGTADLELLQMSVEGTGAGAFSHDGVNQTLRAGRAITVAVRFAPASAAAASAAIRVRTSVPAETDVVVALSGQGIAGGPWADATDLGSGWKRLDWFGTFNDGFPPWIYHAEHGWLCVIGGSPSSLFLWSQSQGWWWTSDAIYPHVYSFADSTWMYYARGTTNPRHFYSYALQRWISTP